MRTAAGFAARFSVCIFAGYLGLFMAGTSDSLLSWMKQVTLRYWGEGLGAFFRVSPVSRFRAPELPTYTLNVNPRLKAPSVRSHLSGMCASMASSSSCPFSGVGLRLQ